MMSDKNTSIEIGKRILERRKRLGMSQEVLAEYADVTPQCISFVETGKRALHSENLKRVASSLGVSADYLLTGDIIDKDMILLSEKLHSLTPSQFRFIEAMIDQLRAFGHQSS